MIRRKQDMPVEMRDKLRGGKGTLRCVSLLDPSECFGKLNYCALIDIEPGQSVGVHAHGPDAEVYYMLRGRLTATDDGVDTYLEEGDAMFTGNGATHSVRNDGEETATLIAVVIA